MHEAGGSQAEVVDDPSSAVDLVVAFCHRLYFFKTTSTCDEDSTVCANGAYLECAACSLSNDDDGA